MVTPALVWVALAAVVAAFAAGWWWRSRPHRAARATYVANSSYVFTLPSFRRRLTLHRLAALGLIGTLGVATALNALLAGRPVDRFTQDERMATRDIVLCLDVSGSMMPFDSQVLRQFAEMIPSFQGERIALSVWNATSRLVFPLTDDYSMVKYELEHAADLLDTDLLGSNSADWMELEQWLAGTYSLTSYNSSLVGDGLANCALAFDLAEESRSRAIILATDNQVAGDEVFTLAQAADFAAERDIRVHAIYAAEFALAGEKDEYQQVITSHDGLFYELSDPAAARGIVDEITAQQAVELDADPHVVEQDRPDRYFGWLVGALAAFLLLAWRARA